MSFISVFDIFKIGIGPSSSHTVGPMLAAHHFINTILANDISEVVSIRVDLYGSLSLTGRGHGTNLAIICGLEGHTPQNVESSILESAASRVDLNSQISLGGKINISTSTKDLIVFNSNSLALHPNGLAFEAVLKDQRDPIRKIYFSIGGGFLSDELGIPVLASPKLNNDIPYLFSSGTQLLSICREENKTISEVVLANEKSIRSHEQIEQGVQSIWSAMDACIEKGCVTSSELAGGLGVKRRAAQMYTKLQASSSLSALSQFDYLSCYALAVNEENAAFGRVVTAPTNGAAGVIPAVFKFYLNQLSGDISRLSEYLLTATAIAILFKNGASLSAAEMGCQGEIGVAASMAAAAITSLHGGTAEQIENAAEIAIEHSLGLTCDPVAGLVQIPCIERNAIGAAKAITASQLALKSDGKHVVSLDQAIAAMKKTGIDMHSKYKETSTGGLAISVAASEC